VACPLQVAAKNAKMSVSKAIIKHIFEFSSPSVSFYEHFLRCSVKGAAGYAALLFDSFL
jgi:hypothetical protein